MDDQLYRNDLGKQKHKKSVDMDIKKELREIKESINSLHIIANMMIVVDDLTRDQVAAALRTTPSNLDDICKKGRKSKSGEKVYLKKQSNGRYKRSDVVDYIKKMY